jgi:uncharacterized protein (TIGR00369 family)
MDEAAARQAFETALREHKPGFETFFLSRLFGIEYAYGEDTCSLRFPVRDFMFNPQGSLHGGLVVLLMDVAMAHLLVHAFGVPGRTLETKCQYLAPVRGPEARCEARFLRKGRSICFLEAHLFDHAGTLAAAGTATWRLNPQGNDKTGRE